MSKKKCLNHKIANLITNIMLTVLALNFVYYSTNLSKLDGFDLLSFGILLIFTVILKICIGGKKKWKI